MIFLDANVILRLLTTSDALQVQQMEAIAAGLFRAVEQGTAQVTTSELVLHEVCFVLSSRRHYNRTPAEIAPALGSILQLEGFVLSSRDLAMYLRALAIWQQHPKLEFSDSVIAARCERHGHELASFDRHFDALHGVRRWQPEAPS